MDRPFAAGSGGLGFSDAERRPVRELYGAIRRSQNDADRDTADLVARLGVLTGLDIEFDDAEGRLLLAGLGGDEDAIYAVPVAVDRIACAVLPNGGGQITAPGPDGLLLVHVQTETGLLALCGVVGDSVEAVDLVVSSVLHQARMGENSFGLRLARTHSDDLERIVLHRRDGTTNEVVLGPED
jgi:hypothetical protein